MRYSRNVLYEGKMLYIADVTSETQKNFIGEKTTLLYFVSNKAHNIVPTASSLQILAWFSHYVMLRENWYGAQKTVIRHDES